MNAVLMLGALMLASLVCAPVAFADEIGDFEAARAAYEAGEYGRAVTLFEAMVGGAIPLIENPILIAESRKYLATSYLFESRPEQAEAQFERLLREDPNYALDPLAFPAAVHDMFRRVQTRVQEEIAARTEDRDAAERERRERALARLLAQQERAARLEELAQQSVVVHEHSRWLATLPLGVGQFQNGDQALGFAFLISEILLSATALSTFIYHDYLEGQADAVPVTSNTPPDLISAARATRVTNQVSLAVLGAVTLIGIIDAHARYEPTVREVSRRPLPDDLQEVEAEVEAESDALAPEETTTQIDVGIGLGTASLRIQF